jgi:chorismate synthase
VIEAMVAFVMADVLLEKLGGDSIPEMKPRFEQLKKGNIADYAMHNTEWRFGYE